ncbi:hypothetical protein X975_04889, partial [Stegodyphus mimosarum]
LNFFFKFLFLLTCFSLFTIDYSITFRKKNLKTVLMVSVYCVTITHPAS